MERHFLYFMLNGLLVFIFGGFFYLVFRSESLITLTVFNAAWLPNYELQCPFIESLPSLLHTLAFCMLTMAFVKFNRRNVLLIGIFWVTNNIAYELFSLTGYAKKLGLQSYGDINDVISSFIGLLAFMGMVFFYLHDKSLFKKRMLL